MRLKKLENFLKQFIPPIISQSLRRRRIERRDRPYDNIPDRAFYQGVFSPWLGYGEFGPLYERMRGVSLVSRERAWMLYTLGRQALTVDGAFYEAGVFRGGTAVLFAELIRRAPAKHDLHLFDTFTGMPETDPERDLHHAGDFAGTSLQGVQARVGNDDFIHYHAGFVPQTFAGREADRIAFAHVDLDIYRSILDACEFIYPRLQPGGFLVFDDYGFMSCPGARQAVDEFFATRREIPLVLPTGQAIVFKGAGG
jgi:O-methyltransferase